MDTDKVGNTDPNDIPVIDWETAMENVGDDRELFLAVKDSAVDEIPGLVPTLVQAIDSGDAPESQRLAHTIKGAARVIAASKTMAVAYKIEKAAEAGELDTARQSIDELLAAIDELIETLDRSEIPG